MSSDTGWGNADSGWGVTSAPGWTRQRGDVGWGFDPEWGVEGDIGWG